MGSVVGLEFELRALHLQSPFLSEPHLQYQSLSEHSETTSEDRREEPCAAVLYSLAEARAQERP
jgi:hypothetical protein